MGGWDQFTCTDQDTALLYIPKWQCQWSPGPTIGLAPQEAFSISKVSLFPSITNIEILLRTIWCSVMQITSTLVAFSDVY